MTDPDRIQPPDAPRWERRPGDRPREILDAALSAFGLKGYDCATLADIAERAGVSAGTVTHYFGSKAGLFEALLQDRFLEGFAEGEALLAAHQGPSRDLMRALLTQMWERITRPGMPDLLLVGMAKSTTFPDACQVVFRAISERWRRLLAGVIEAGIRRGEYRPVEPLLTARVLAGGLAGMMLGLHRFACYDPAAPSPDLLLEQYLDVVDHALRHDSTSDPNAGAALTQGS